VHSTAAWGWTWGGGCDRPRGHLSRRCWPKHAGARARGTARAAAGGTAGVTTAVVTVKRAAPLPHGYGGALPARRRATRNGLEAVGGEGAEKGQGPFPRLWSGAAAAPMDFFGGARRPPPEFFFFPFPKRPAHSQPTHGPATCTLRAGNERAPKTGGGTTGRVARTCTAAVNGAANGTGR